MGMERSDRREGQRERRRQGTSVVGKREERQSQDGEG